MMKIKIYLITEFYIIICLLSGYFYEVMSMYLCLIVHEIGHFIMIKLLKKDILLLEISPLGGILHIDKCQNDHNYKEFLIYLSGPLASLLLYIAFYLFQVNEILLRSAFYILILNILPILPLDGGKMIMILQCYFLSFKKVLKVITLLSILFCISLIIYFINNYNYVIILIFFVSGAIIELKPPVATTVSFSPNSF